jgi:phosphonate transport system permease protein
LVSAHLPSPQERIAGLAEAYERKIAVRRRQTYALLATLFALTLLASYAAEVRLPVLIGNIGNFTSYFERIIPELRWATLSTDFGEWMWGLSRWSRLLFDTVLIAYLATLCGAAGALMISFFAANNLVSNPVLRFTVKRFLEFCRTVPDLVFALIFVRAFGLGAMAGVLALTIHSFGSLGKLFSEAVENIDMKPVESVRSAGAAWPQAVRFGVVPQVLPTFLSYGLLRFEVNVRTATVIGFVGAGGIGQDFLEAIRKFYYSDVSAMLVMITITVFAIDIVADRLRKALTGRETPE